LRDGFKLDADRLYASVFEGSVEDGVAPDDEARSYWQEVLPDDHIIPGNKKDNFWEMGDTGPCGPCSEIHVDLRSPGDRATIPGASLVNQGHPLVVEIWNLVFIQYNRKADGSLEQLPQKHVDTGMGLERLCMAVQGKYSNYDTDVFQNLIRAIEKIGGHTYGQEKNQT
jgi:alanyl-tRNA synthetase